MPGLVGVISNDPEDKLLLDRMADSVKHKGWQQIDRYTEPPFNIARVHLGIFNPEAQPIFNEHRTLCIFMDGKIYGCEGDMEELKREHKFVFSNDAEFCLHAYEEYGREFVKRLNLNGAFTMAICDLKRGKLVIINDRYGLRPLYYTITNNRLLFAPEMKAILQDAAFKKDLNEETVADFFAFGEIFGNKTFFKGIEVLPPASIFTYDKENASIERYWDFNYDPDYDLSEDKLVDLLTGLFRKAVEIRIKDNLRYGIALSGGLDSRAILGAIAKEKRKDIATITFGIPGCDEARIAEIASKVAGTKHIFIPVDPNEVLTPYPEKVVYLTEGVAPVHISHQVFVYEKLKQYTDVLLDGLAFDILLGGSRLEKRLFKIKTNAELLKTLNTRRIFSDDMMAKLFFDKCYREIKDMPYQSLTNALSEVSGHPANRYDYITLQRRVRRWTFCAGNTIIRQIGAEQAPPTYDYNLIDLILKIPPELRFGHYIYRKFLKKLAPELARIPYDHTMIRADAPLILWGPASLYQAAKGIIERQLWRISGGRIYLPNRRTYAPVDEWLRVNPNWRMFSRNTLLSGNACIKDFCRQGFIQRLIEEHETGKANHFARINLLLTFEFFLRIFIVGSLEVSDDK